MRRQRRSAQVRIMDPMTNGNDEYPHGYAASMNAQGRTVNPLTGETALRTEPYAHTPRP